MFAKLQILTNLVASRITIQLAEPDRMYICIILIHLVMILSRNVSNREDKQICNTYACSRARVYIYTYTYTRKLLCVCLNDSIEDRRDEGVRLRKGIRPLHELPYSRESIVLSAHTIDPANFSQFEPRDDT